MRGAVGSLNAAVAGSVLLFEAVAQRDPEGRGRHGRRRPRRPSAADRRPTPSRPPIEPGRARSTDRRAGRRPRPPRPAADRAAEPTATPRPGRRSRAAGAEPADADVAADADLLPGGPRRGAARQTEADQRRPEPPRSKEPPPTLDPSDRPALSFPGAGSGHLRYGPARRADVAQLVEQRFCKPQVPGSSPVVGSIANMIR